jgi:hypothetical protein
MRRVESEGNNEEPVNNCLTQTGLLMEALLYWCRLFGSWRGEHYFAHHIRNASEEIAALVADVRALVLKHKTLHLRRLYDAIDRRRTSSKSGDSAPDHIAELREYHAPRSANIT